MRSTLVALPLRCLAGPVAAQLTTTYAGTQIVGSKQVPATAKFVVETVTYVWTKDTKTVAGYQCTFVQAMHGGTKVSEYCGSPSADFTISDAERGTVLDMQRYLRNFTIMVRTPDDATRAFQWDTSVDGDGSSFSLGFVNG